VLKPNTLGGVSTMASRLYPTTRRLFQQVVQHVKVIGLGAALSPLVLALVVLYVTGLLLLDRRQNGTRIADWLPARAHDALNRLVRSHELSTRALMKSVIGWARRLGTGYLVVDDVMVSKPFCKRCPWVGWTYSTSEKRKVRGFHVVVLLWCTSCWRIPVAFRLWRPQKSCRPKRYRKKTQLAWEMIVEVQQQGLDIDYIAFDTFYTAGWMTKKINRLGWKWVGVLHPRTIVHYRNRRWEVASLGAWLRLKWRARPQLRARSIVAYLPKYGTLRLVVTRNRHGNVEVLATNDLDSDLTTIVLRKRSRWSIETLFRDAKQFSGLAACQCRVDQALVRHVALVLIAFVILQRLRLHPKETLGEVKDRLQRELITGGLPAPRPLRGKVALAQLSTA
jgi:SRSO17 transposase